MEALDNAKAYLMLALQECDALYDTNLSPDPDNPSEAIAEVETGIQDILGKLDNLK